MTTTTRLRLCAGCRNCYLNQGDEECTHCARKRGAGALGWSYVSDHSCPRRLVGKRCRNHYRSGSCWCSRQLFGLNDHGATWKRSDGSKFVLWEPYHAHSEDLAELAAAAAADGLRFDICQSVWNPPATIGIRFEAKDNTHD